LCGLQRGGLRLSLGRALVYFVIGFGISLISRAQTGENRNLGKEIFSDSSVAAESEQRSSPSSSKSVDKTDIAEDENRDLKKSLKQSLSQDRRQKQDRTQKVPGRSSRASFGEGRGFPADIQNFIRFGSEEIHSGVVLPVDTKEEKLLHIRAGDQIEIEILHSIMAFPDEKSPVVGRILEGTLKNAKLFGRAYLEKNSHRIFIEFERVSFNNSTYEMKSHATTKEGQTGFVGEYYSREGEYFAGDFLAAFVAGYFDSQVPRSTNVFGQIQEEKSVDAGFKKGLATGAMSTADRFKEKLKKVPEFSELKGPLSAKLLVLEGGQRL